MPARRPRHRARTCAGPAGTLADFKYTDALKKSATTWTPATLDHWLEFPHSVAPGTSMGLVVPNAGHRSVVIAFRVTRKDGKPAVAAKP